MSEYRTKRSAGIACCRYNKNELEILLVKKRYSYGLFAFVMGNYNLNDSKSLRNMFNNMTYNEKSDILTFQFSVLWHRIWGYVPVNDPPVFDLSSLSSMNRLWKYVYKKTTRNNGLPVINDTDYNIYATKLKKFNTLIRINNGEKLRSIIFNSFNVRLLWEIPRGRIEANETKISAAVREFKEETSISVDDYYIPHHILPINRRFVSDGVIYDHSYYIGFSNTIEDDSEMFKNDKLSPEIECLQWCDMRTVASKYCNSKELLYTIVPLVFKAFLENYSKI
jgi:hypothetical protein